MPSVDRTCAIEDGSEETTTGPRPVDIWSDEVAISEASELEWGLGCSEKIDDGGIEVEG